MTKNKDTLRGALAQLNSIQENQTALADAIKAIADSVSEHIKAQNEHNGNQTSQITELQEAVKSLKTGQQDHAIKITSVSEFAQNAMLKSAEAVNLFSDVAKSSEVDSLTKIVDGLAKADEVNKALADNSSEIKTILTDLSGSVDTNFKEQAEALSSIDTKLDSITEIVSKLRESIVTNTKKIHKQATEFERYNKAFNNTVTLIKKASEKLDAYEVRTTDLEEMLAEIHGSIKSVEETNDDTRLVAQECYKLMDSMENRIEVSRSNMIEDSKKFAKTMLDQNLEMITNGGRKYMSEINSQVEILANVVKEDFDSITKKQVKYYDDLIANDKKLRELVNNRMKEVYDAQDGLKNAISAMTDTMDNADEVQKHLTHWAKTLTNNLQLLGEAYGIDLPKQKQNQTNRKSTTRSSKRPEKE